VGLIGIEEFVSKPNSISLFSINNQLANQCYLVLHDQNGSKDPHMSVLIDLVGASTSTDISGFFNTYGCKYKRWKYSSHNRFSFPFLGW
jgi:hypothetical protein